MIISIPFSELSEEIKKFSGKEIVLEYVSKDTFKVSIAVNIPLFGRRLFGLNMTVIGFDSRILKVKVNDSRLLLKVLGLLIPNLDYSQYAEINGDEIKILLGNVEKLQKAFDYILLQRLYFDERTLHLEASLI